VAAALLTPLGAAAQGNPIGTNDVVTAYHKNQNRFEILLKGDEKPGSDDKGVADALAQWFIYPMSWTREKRDKLGDFKGYTLRDHAIRLDNQVKTHAIPNATKNQEFMKLWTERMIATFQDAFEKLLPNAKENRVGVVNIALLLPIYARTRDERFEQYLEALLADEKQHDAVRLYAVKALRSYPAARPHKRSDDPDDENYKELQKQIASDIRRVEALLKFVNRKWDGDPVVAQFIRREALQTLGETRVPMMNIPQKDGKVVAPVAYTLARFLASGKDGPYPPPSLSEKVEAAIGLLQLDTRGLEGYHVEPGLYLAGQLLLEFTNEYVKDYTKFGGKLGIKKEKDERKIPPVWPWKFMGERLAKSLEWLKTGIRDNDPAYAKAAALREKAQEIIVLVRSHSAIDTRHTAALQQAVAALQPRSEALYEGNKEYKVPLTGPPGD
jgi:hypothetical protein